MHFKIQWAPNNQLKINLSAEAQYFLVPFSELCKIWYFWNFISSYCNKFNNQHIHLHVLVTWCGEKTKIKQLQTLDVKWYTNTPNTTLFNSWILRKKKKEWLNEWSLVILSIKSYVIVYVCMSMQVCVRTMALDMTWQVNTWDWTQTTHSEDLFPSLNWTFIYFAHAARSFLVLLFFMQSSWKGVI